MIRDESFIIEEGGVRLDAALLMAYPSSTRAFVREAIEAGDVRVNGRHIAKGAKLRGGETVQVVRLAEQADNLVAPDKSISPCAVYEDAALLAFDKPAGMAVHPLSRHETGTLMNGVIVAHPECAPLGDRPLMAGALHRIDAGTSGLVLVARTARAFENLRAQFAAQSIVKTYLALVEGRFALAGVLENELAHDPLLPYCRMIDVRHNRLTQAQRARLRPLHAVTRFRPVGFATEGCEERTLLEITIQTGVTHQIRAQLAFAGMHIVNDRLYGAFAVENQVGHCLHALSATFRHPETNQEMTVATPPPAWASVAVPCDCRA